VVAGVAWIAITGLIARAHSHFLSAQVSKLEAALVAGDSTEADRIAHEMQSKSASTHALTSGPAWWVAAHVPFLDGPVTSIRAQAALLDDLASTAMPDAVSAGEALNPKLLRTGPDSIDLDRLSAALPALEKASAAATAAKRKSLQLPGKTWLGATNRSQASLLHEIDTLDTSLTDLTTAARVLPGPLGATGVHRYFVAFETDAEARGLGGLPGDYAILRTDHGRMDLTRFGSDQDLDGASSNLDFGVAYNEMYDGQFSPQKTFQNSDSSPHFPYAAQIWMGMWEDRFHQHLDGAIATDPSALGDLLSAVGPVTLADGTVINSDDAVRFFENATYLAFPSYDLAPRKAFQVLASRAVADQIIHQPSSDLLHSASALQTAAEEGHLLVYVSDPVAERALIGTPLAGIVPETTRPFLDVVVNNTSGTKLDYYLSRTVTYTRASCGATPVSVTVTLHNAAPDHGLPDSVLGRAPGIRPEPIVGEEGFLLSVYGTTGSYIETASVDGKPAYLESNVERGHPVASIPLDIKPDQTLSVTFHFDDPAATGPLILATQPTIDAQHTTISGAGNCPIQ
jgi:hypothetical protein